jgi:hypothetical protein
MGGKLAMLGSCTALSAVLVAVACGPDPRDAPSIEGIDTCVDQDGDGFGHGCPLGADCDDDDPDVTSECRDAGGVVDPGDHPPGCEQDATLECTYHVDAGPGAPLCVPGKRTCVDGGWSACVPAED